MPNVTDFQWVAASVIATLSVARTARLIIHDDLPPMVWARARIFALYREDSKWVDLLACPFCLAPYLAVGMVGWAWVSDFHWTWWVINGWWALSYAAAMVYAYDQPD